MEHRLGRLELEQLEGELEQLVPEVVPVVRRKLVAVRLEQPERVVEQLEQPELVLVQRRPVEEQPELELEQPGQVEGLQLEP